MNKRVSEMLTTKYYNTCCESFQCLEEIDPLIDEIEKRSQNKLKIKKSLPDCFACTFALSTQSVSTRSLSKSVLMGCLS